MQSRTPNSFFGLGLNVATDNPLVAQAAEISGSTPPPISKDFLLMDGTDFLLMDGTNFLLMGT